MLSIENIEKYYSAAEAGFKRSILREYLQYKILKIIFDTDAGIRLSFMGGTCLRIVYGTKRFSEDLDFDNFNISKEDFLFISETVSKNLEKEGCTVEIKNVFHNAFRCYIRIPSLLFSNRLSGFEEEKILIQLDSEAQGFSYSPEQTLINKFDVITKIPVTPKSILLSQKYWALLNRKVIKGRDMYDVIFLSALTEPDFNYLEFKAGITDMQTLKSRVLEKLNEINPELLIKDVSPFLINISDSSAIKNFREFIIQKL